MPNNNYTLTHQLYLFSMLHKFAPVLGLCFMLFCAPVTHAQNIAAVSSPADTALANYYHQAIGYSSGLYSGIEYKPHSPVITGIPFYASNNWVKGTVIYNDVAYNDVLMKYDLVDDQLIALLYNQALPYVLNQSKVRAFDLANHHFVYAVKDSLQKQSFTDGYYEQLYNGKTMVLARYEKKILESGNATSLESKYDDRTRYYIKSQGLYYAVSSNGSVANALADKKKLIQQYLKSNHIKINKNSPDALVQVATYYDTLTN